MPLDDLFAKYARRVQARRRSTRTMRKAMSYDGKLYGLPMQAQMLT